jgi:hypothetical protein
MKFETTDSVMAMGTSLQGYVEVSYDVLVDVFGEPNIHNSGDGKVKCSWVIDFGNRKIATIYDWKSYDRTNIEDIVDWHIGGFGMYAVDYIEKAINSRDEYKNDKITPAAFGRMGL